MHPLVQNLSKILTRNAILGACFFLPSQQRIQLERWLRGRNEASKLRRCDAVIVSYGKSGRTWLRVMLSRFYQTLHQLPGYQLLGFDNMHRLRPAIPKIFFTHDNYLKDYTGNHGNKSDYYHKKTILLVRDPRDVAVSQFFQWKYRMRPGKKKLNRYPPHGADISIFDFVMDTDVGLPKIIDFMNLWAREVSKIEHLLIVRYEDLRADTANQLKRMTQFLGTPGDEKTILDAVEFSSIENMRKLEQEKKFRFSGSRLVPKDKSNLNSYKVRRAKVGGWQDYFDDNQCAQINALVESLLDPSFGYTSSMQPKQVVNV
ncbi:MAG: sulfotransferase [Methylothermaceae bacteria B42]|nr:MAG: sulfotransferase [Methylothermaceae bacteria B42]HHJ39094.1 sulfotransferase [Methylothermaceae bacterium]